MRPNESVDPSRGVDSDLAGASPAVAPGPAGPLAEVPNREDLPRARDSRGVGLADVLVVVLALVVLALSLVGLAWVLRSR